MKKSNIFAHIELTKLVNGLSSDPEKAKASLIALHSYFKIIPSAMLSENLASDWEAVCSIVSRLEPVKDEDGKIVVTSIKRTISEMQNEECLDVISRIIKIQRSVAQEF